MSEQQSSEKKRILAKPRVFTLSNMTPTELQACLEATDVSMRILAQQMGCAITTINRWKQGKTEIPTPCAVAMRFIFWVAAKHGVPYLLDRDIGLNPLINTPEDKPVSKRNPHKERIPLTPQMQKLKNDYLEKLRELKRKEQEANGEGTGTDSN